MGYKTNSPIKQAWLPLDYNWIIENAASGEGVTFKDFSIKYKEEYGIDLHDIFSLERNADNFAIGLKVDLLGSYTIGGLSGGNFVKKIAKTNAFCINTMINQGAENVALAHVSITDETPYIGHGFYLTLPAIGTDVNSIDDLLVESYEM